MPYVILHNNSKKSSKSRIIGSAVTIIMHGAFIGVLLSVWITRAPRVDMINIDLEIVADMPEPPPPPRPSPTVEPQQQRVNAVRASPAKPLDPDPVEQPPAIDNTGDVEVTKAEPVINPRSIYQGSDQGKNPEASEEDPRNLYRGSPEGQDTSSDAAPSVDLGGRSVRGKLGEPKNTSNKEGRVVVEIKVDQAGKVIQAKARARGSSVQDAALWKAAETAALETLFNTDNKAPILQVGTITYIFKLR